MERFGQASPEKRAREEQGKGEGKDVLLVGDAGIMLDTKVRGKGYAVAALGMVIDYRFRVLGLDECRIAAKGDNMAMRCLMEKRMDLAGKELRKTNLKMSGF